MSAVSTAGWVISVCSSCCSSCATAAGSVRSMKMYSVSGLPSSGVITASASAKVRATIGSFARSSSSMLTYCEPWPVKKKATLGAGPPPMKTPRARSIRRVAAVPLVSAAAAMAALSASSAAPS